MRDKTAQIGRVLASRLQEAMRRSNVGEDDLALETNIPGSVPARGEMTP